MDLESLKDKETIKAAVLVVVTNAIASAVTTMWERLTAAPASANCLLGTSFGNNSALNSCKTKIDCPYIMPNKSNSEEVYYLELKAKKSISEVVTSERDSLSPK
jgi:hypothetical protein